MVSINETLIIRAVRVNLEYEILFNGYRKGLICLNGSPGDNMPEAKVGCCVGLLDCFDSDLCSRVNGRYNDVEKSIR